ncbi:hypothetical protein LTR59_008974 [Friedmanniomyces endolithicus]|nr:hypothetical protein LTR94_008601 [Friedmanniomyces endolithicus]KAK0791249.1 hypothetical protein LTR59_008974 [Friedmanniomyces endolithicus]KAK0797510.1 hypothetical protein LTR38_008213 [Friedmanniomyces endolithicus]
MEAGREVALSRGASKRPTDDAQQSHNALQDLFDLLRDRPQREATNILRRIRNGESVDNLLTSAKNGDQSRSVISPANQGAIKILLTNLLRSGASLEQIASTVVYEVVTLKAQPVDNDGRRANIPYSVFDGSGLLGARQSPGIPLQIGSNAARKRAATAQLSNRAPYGDDKLDMPPFILPAKPWTDITDNSIFVSCLVRDFLNYHNPYWRFLEADLFLQGMRSGKVGSDFCSPLLVNAVCALACLHVDYQDAFVQPGDLPTRGKHFHDEALHLWLLEAGRASVTNLQALAVLAIESSWRGKDKLGSTFLTVALRMNKDLPLDDITSTSQRELLLRYDDAYVNLTSGLADRKIAFAKMAANMMRDFRQKYSMKATRPYTFQASSMASFALLQWLHDHPDQRDPPPLPQSHEILTATDMHHITALNEAYRCVLGAATQVMLARGVVALLNQTASHMNVKLPALDLQVEEAVADVTWRASDLRHISSAYPNYAQGTVPTFSEAIGMEDILKEWGKALPYR